MVKCYILRNRDFIQSSVSWTKVTDLLYGFDNGVSSLK
jgi:hypothetical protein